MPESSGSGKKKPARKRASPRRKSQSKAKPASKPKKKSPPRRRVRRAAPKKVPVVRTMLVSVDDERTRIAVLEDEELVEHYAAGSDSRSIIGNIYLGRVQKVLPGMEAAFIDIGVERNAVIHAGKLVIDEDVEGNSLKIEKALKTGQSLLAQVTKDPMGSKGAALTSQVTLPGRFVVLVPDATSVGISRRLPDDERVRLRKIADHIQPPDFGLIVRTAAEGAGEDELDRDVSTLVQLWYEVQEKAESSSPPALIYEEPELVIRVVRDLYTRDVSSVLVDKAEVVEKLKEYVSEVSPDLAERIERSGGRKSLFRRKGVNDQIAKALDRRVPLASGGSIIIDKTEAMTVIDVNTGRFVGKSALEDTVLKTNLEAAEEVAKQLRLRDIGGIIVIDFIDLLEAKNRKKLIEKFDEALARDKTRSQTFGVSELGLIEMTRKRVSEGLLEAYSEACDKCRGLGVILHDLE